jgi:predicted  nucleic acid-binding Zn-ribbon protein
MMRFVGRVLVPARLRQAIRSRLDAKYVAKADHRQDVRSIREEFRRLHRKANAEHRGDAKDTLREIQSLRREIQSLRREVVALRAEADRVQQVATAGKSAAHEAGAARRLAEQTAMALDYVLQNEVRTWQAIDGLTAQMPATEPVR